MQRIASRSNIRCRQGPDERGVVPIFEVVLAFTILLIMLVPVAQLLGGLDHTSNQYRQSVVAQNYALEELSNLRAEAAADSGFPPADADAPTTLTPSATVPLLSSSDNNGTYYGIYAVGGWCSQSVSSPYAWGAYSAVPTSTKQPPGYWVAVIVTWSKSTPGSITVSGATYAGPFTVSANPHLILTGLIATPQGDQSEDSTTLPSVCPAVIR